MRSRKASATTKVTMYVMKSLIVLIAVFALTLALAACDDDGFEALRGSGNVVTEDFEFADFASVEVFNVFDAEIVQSDSFSVRIRADDYILDLINVSKNGETLSVRLRQGLTISADVTLEARITMPDLEALDLRGATSATVSGFRSEGQIDIEVSGASNLDGDMEAERIDLDVSGASRVMLTGSAVDMTMVGSGASNIDLADFPVDTAEVSLSGASEATVNVHERIDSADVSGASRLRYLGDPSLGDVSTSGASTLDKIGD